MTSRSTPRRRGPRGGLDRRTFVAAGRAVLRERGPAGLSLRAVATAAGTAPTALYTYFADMDDLTNAVADDLIAEIELTPLRTSARVPDARTRLRAFFAAAADVMRANPGMAELLGSRRVIGPASMGLNEALLALLVGQGLTLETASDVVYALTAYLHGHMAFNASAELPSGAVRALAALRPEDHPLTAQALATSASPSARARAGFPGLEVLLDGIGLPGG